MQGATKDLRSIVRPPDAGGSGGARAAIVLVLVVTLGLSLLAGKQPLLGLIAFVAACALVAVTRSGAVAVCAFAATLYFEIATVYTGAAASPVKLAGGGLVLLAIVALLVRARRAVTTPHAAVAPERSNTAEPGWMQFPLLIALGVGFTGWALSSIAWATSGSHVKEFGMRLVTDLLIFLAVPVFLTTARHLRMLGWTLLGCAAGAIATGQLLGANLEGRAIGTFADPNEYAAALVPAIALGLVVGESSDSGARRWLARGLAAYGTYGVLASGSRGGLLAVLVAFIVLLVTARGAERVRMTGILVLAVSVGAAWLLLTPAGDTLRSRITEGGSSGRSDLWKVAVYQFEDNPVKGVGLGNYPVVSRDYITRARVQNSDLFLGYPKVVHSTPLELLAELGLVGFLLYYGLVLGCIGAAMRALRAARALEDSTQWIPIGRGLIAATLAVVATTAFLSGHYFELSWVLFASCIAYAAMVRRAAADEARAATLAATAAAAIADPPPPPRVAS